MRGWLDIMVRIAAVCLLLIAGVQASAACAAADLAPRHSAASALMVQVQDMHMADHRPAAGHPAGGMVCMRGCISWIDEPIAAAQSMSFSKIAVLRPDDEAQPASLRPDMAERPPKPRV